MQQLKSYETENASAKHDGWLSFFVCGNAAPAGSKTGGIINGHLIMRPASKRTKPWMHDVAAVARSAHRGPLITGPIELCLTFVRVRPKAHYRTGRHSDLLRASAPEWPTTKPDLTKTIRAIEDALTGVIWRDDSQVVKQTTEKIWGEPAGVLVRIREL